MSNRPRQPVARLVVDLEAVIQLATRTIDNLDPALLGLSHPRTDEARQRLIDARQLASEAQHYMVSPLRRYRWAGPLPSLVIGVAITWPAVALAGWLTNHSATWMSTIAALTYVGMVLPVRKLLLWAEGQTNRAQVTATLTRHTTADQHQRVAASDDSTASPPGVAEVKSVVDEAQSHLSKVALQYLDGRYRIPETATELLRRLGQDVVFQKLNIADTLLRQASDLLAATPFAPKG